MGQVVDKKKHIITIIFTKTILGTSFYTNDTVITVIIKNYLVPIIDQICGMAWLTVKVYYVFKEIRAIGKQLQ